MGNKSKIQANRPEAKQINVQQATENSQIKPDMESKRKSPSSITENKETENRSVRILTRRTKSVTTQEDSRIKSCAVLAVKLKYPYVARKTTVKLNTRSNDKKSVGSDLSKPVSRTIAVPPETDLRVQSGSRKSSRMKKPTSKELPPILPPSTKISSTEQIAQSDRVTATESVELKNDAVPEKKIENDMECVKCGLTPSQLFHKDLQHNTVCCFCSLVKPPQELLTFLQLLKLDCCLKVLNQKNQNAVENSSEPPRKRKMNDHIAVSSKIVQSSSIGQRNAAVIGNSGMRTLRERNAVRAQKDVLNQNLPEEQTKSADQPSKPIKQQKGTSTLNVSKPTSTANTSQSSAARMSLRLVKKSVVQEKQPAKAMTPTIKVMQKSLKRKMSPQTTQILSKKRKLMQNTEAPSQKIKVQMLKAKDHKCSSCNTSFTMQWKLKLHELTHSDKSYPNVVLRHTEVSENTSNHTEKNEDGELMECDPVSENLQENVAEKECLNAQISESAVHQTDNTSDKMQESSTASELEDNINCKEDSEHPDAYEKENEIKKPVLDVNQDTVVKVNGNDEIQKTKKLATDVVESNTTADEGNIEVNEKSDEMDSCAAAECEPNAVCNDSSEHLAKQDNNDKELDLSGSFEDKNQSSTSSIEINEDKECDELQIHDKTADSIDKNTEEGEKLTKQRSSAGTPTKIDTEQPQLKNTLVECDKMQGEETENVQQPTNEEPEEAEATKEINDREENEEIYEISSNDLAEREAEVGLDKTNVVNIAGEQTEDPVDKINEGDKAEGNLEMKERNSGGNISLNISDHDLEQTDDLIGEKDSTNSADEERSENGKSESKSPHCGDVELEDTHNKIKMNGASIETDDGITPGSSCTTTEEEKDNSEDAADANLTEIYNQMNKIFEGSPEEGKKGRKTEINKTSDDDCQLENRTNASDSSDQKTLAEDKITSQE